MLNRNMKIGDLSIKFNTVQRTTEYKYEIQSDQPFSLLSAKSIIYLLCRFILVIYFKKMIRTNLFREYMNIAMS